MAQYALILDNHTVDVISSARENINDIECMSKLDKKMSRAGLQWHEGAKKYIKIHFHPPPIREVPI